MLQEITCEGRLLALIVKKDFQQQGTLDVEKQAKMLVVMFH